MELLMWLYILLLVMVLVVNKHAELNNFVPSLLLDVM